MNTNDNITENVADRAVAKITEQKADAGEALKKEKASGGIALAKKEMKKIMIDDLSRMLTKFCYQSEEFAEAVEKSDRTLLSIVEDIMKLVSPTNPGISDVTAYMTAVKAYLSEAEVICSFRINIHKEQDDDLLDLESFAQPEEAQSGAIILDLFTSED